MGRMVGTATAAAQVNMIVPGIVAQPHHGSPRSTYNLGEDPGQIGPDVEGCAQPATPMDLRQTPTPPEILICPGDHPQILLATGLQEETRGP